MTHDATIARPGGPAGRRRRTMVAAVAISSAFLLVPGLAAAAEDGGEGGGGGGGQMGPPTSLVFALTWETNDGVVHDSMPAPALAGFGAVSFNAGGQEMGTATCTQTAGSDQLTCTYQNKGHGGTPGLVLPKSPKATFTVTMSDVPAGWTVDPTTVGTFTGGEACPRSDGEDEGGGHGGGGGHETTTTTTLEGAMPAAEGGGPGDEGGGPGDEGGGPGDEGGRPVVTCTHVVALIQDPAPPAPPAPPTLPAAVESATVAAPVAVAPAVTG